MDDIRVGRILRALRIRRGWTQRELGRRAGLSQQAISLIERGHSSRLSGDALRRVFAALDARWEPTVSWRGGDLDRLLDQQHANIVAEVVRRLRRSDWEVVVEATYSEWGERGSIDVIGARRPERAMLIVEIKSDLTNAESTLRKADEKDRIGRGILFVPDTNGGGGTRGAFVRKRVRRRSTCVATTSSRASIERNRP
jgi:transcriptional regulator with XRE-family HTH domain